MARPTGPFTWASNAGTRETPTTGLQASGWLGLATVPSKLMNGLFGNVVDWLAYLKRGDPFGTVAAGSLYWDHTPDGADFAMASPRAPVSLGTPLTNYGVVRMHTDNSSSSRSASAVVHNAGFAETLSGVSIEVTGTLGAWELDVTILVFDANGNQAAWTLENATTKAVHALTKDSGDDTFEGPISFAVIMGFSPDSTAEAYAEIGNIELTLT